MAKEVAHNIKSPVIAMEMLLPFLVNVPERIQKIFKNSVCEIKSLSDRLSKQPSETEVTSVPSIDSRILHD
jgi:hypothetical protein